MCPPQNNHQTTTKLQSPITWWFGLVVWFRRAFPCKWFKSPVATNPNHQLEGRLTLVARRRPTKNTGCPYSLGQAGPNPQAGRPGREAAFRSASPCTRACGSPRTFRRQGSGELVSRVLTTTKAHGLSFSLHFQCIYIYIYIYIYQPWL